MNDEPGGQESANCKSHQVCRHNDRGLLGRSLRIAFLMLALAIAGLMIAAWLGGSPADLPFDYGGFD